MTSTIKFAVDEIIAAIRDRPDDFVLDEHTMTDTESGIVFWIGSGMPRVWRPFELKLGWWHGAKFSRAVKALKAYRTAQAMRLVPAIDKNWKE